MTQITTLLFDVDGTLVDSNKLHVRAWREVLLAAGHDIPEQAIHDQIGKGGDHLVPSLLPDLPADEQDRIASGHGPVYKAKYIGEVRAFPAARAMLARAKATGLTVALATSANGEELDHYLELLDARQLVDATTSKDDVASSKPDPDIFLAALEKTGARAEATLAIGDSPYDVIAAGRAGIGTIALLSGDFVEADLRRAGAIAIYRDSGDLLANWEASPIRSRQPRGHKPRPL